MFYARERLAPMAARAAAILEPSARDVVQAVIDRCDRGDFDVDGDHPARLHGDLWSGNVMWTPGGVTLIDPQRTADTGRPTWRCWRCSAARFWTRSSRAISDSAPRRRLAGQGPAASAVSAACARRVVRKGIRRSGRDGRNARIAGKVIRC